MLKNFFQFFFRRLKIAYRKSFNTKYINLHGIKIKLSHEFISKDIKHLFYMDAYENNEIEILKKILTKNDTVMELGSGIGFISSYCSKVIGSEKVFTFEANPKLISEIKDTYLQNNVNPTIKNVILSNHDGFEDFFVEKTFYSSSQIKRNNTIEKIKIKCSDINFEIQNINPSLLIIDIEGGEKNTIPLINFKKNIN